MKVAVYPTLCQHQGSLYTLVFLWWLSERRPCRDPVKEALQLWGSWCAWFSIDYRAVTTTEFWVCSSRVRLAYTELCGNRNQLQYAPPSTSSLKPTWTEGPALLQDSSLEWTTTVLYTKAPQFRNSTYEQHSQQTKNSAYDKSCHMQMIKRNW